MDVERVTEALRGFGEEHRQVLTEFPRRETQLLELVAMTLAAIHYERQGYAISPRNLEAAGTFRMKLGSSGDPRNFSWWSVTRDGVGFEIHANLPVFSFYGADNGVYVVDISIVRSDALRHLRRIDARRVALPNGELLTFAEVKKLVIYPMLLAQFLGIVHELLPRFLYGRRPRRFQDDGHFDPALMSIAYLQGVSRGIVRAYPERGFRVKILPGCDYQISRLRDDPGAPSPLGRGAVEGLAT